VADRQTTAKCGAAEHDPPVYAQEYLTEFDARNCARLAAHERGSPWSSLSGLEKSVGRTTGRSFAGRTVARPKTPEEMGSSFDQSTIWQHFPAIFRDKFQATATGNAL
jgi:hypothetical protein